MLLLLSVIVGSLAWEILERLLAQIQLRPGLAIGPFGMDLSVFRFDVKLNPGSFAGIWLGAFLFKWI